MEKQTDRQTDKQTDRKKDTDHCVICLYRGFLQRPDGGVKHPDIAISHTTPQSGTDRQTDKQIDRETDRQTDGETDRQIDRQTYTDTDHCVLCLYKGFLQRPIGGVKYPDLAVPHTTPQSGRHATL